MGYSKINSDTKVRLSIELSQVSIKEVLSTIESKSDYVFFYSDEISSELNKRVSIDVKSKTINDILANLLKDTNLSFKFNENQVAIVRKQATSAANSIRINGSVKDKDKNPLPGVNITIKGTSVGTASDINGNFFLEVPDKNAVLQFQFIGFEPQEIKVGNQININVTLKENETELEEVVVVGYGSQKRVSVVGSITTIEPGKLQAGTTRSMSNNLAGQLAGVIGVQRSGEPGYDNSNFWIRGISSFAGNNNPLVLVDGVERSLNNIDPAEIESFSVLKDASASAVYGVRGANGVIIINTKRGEIGKPKVSVRLDQGITKLGKLPEFVGSADYLSLLNEIARDENKPERYTEEQIEKYRTGEDPDLYPDVDWVDAITDDYGHNTRGNVTVSGGSDLLRYSLVGSFYNEKGIISRDSKQAWNSSSNLNRYNVRSNVDVDITKTTVFRVNIGGYLQDRRRAPQSVDGLFSLAFDTPPFVHPQQYSSGEIPVVPERANPWAWATQTGYETFSDSKLESLFSIEQNLNFITKGLKTKALFSFDRFQGNGVSRNKTPDLYNPSTGRNEDGSLDLLIYRYGQNFLNHSNSSDWGDKRTYLEWTVSYDRTFGKHTLNGMFLFNRSNFEDGSKLPYRNQGIAGRASYTYDSRYVAEVNFGYNGSENFAKGSRYGFFPSIALGWLLSEEPFMKAYKETFSKIKFRGSYGLVGNDQLGANRGDYRFAYLTTIGDTDGYRWGVDNDYHRAGRWEGNVGVPNLTWETVKKANLGFELGLWNAVELQVDFFKDRRENIFLQRQTMPGSAGFIQTPFQNFGIVNNQGIDLSLTANKQVTKDFMIS
ncbi:MAG: TonB-dependent receptor, partial [Parabacteroides sp.]|nr:TonB-dependent receptor [Parabacteroides sp.]